MFQKDRLTGLVLLLVLGLLLNCTVSIQAEEKEVIELDLKEGIKLGLERNSSLQQLKSRMEAARAAVEQVEAQLKPRVSINSRYTRFDEEQRINRNSINASKDLYSHQLNLNYLLYQTPAKLKVKQKEYQWQNIKEEYQHQKKQLAYRITQNYYEILKAQELVRVNQESLKQVKEHLKQTRAHLKAGNAVKTDLLQTKVRKSEVQQQFLQAKNNLQLARERFKNQLEIKGSKQIELTEDIGFPEVDLSMPKALDSAFDKRSDLNSLQAELKSLRQGLKWAQKSDNPNLALSGKVSKEGSEFNPESDEFWSVTVNLEWDLYDGGENEALVEQSKSNLEAQESALDKKKQSIDLEVREGFLNLDLSRKQKATAKQRVESAQENLRLAKLRYKEGVAINTEVIDAQVELSKAKTDHQQSVYDYYINQAALLKSMGMSYLSVHNSETDLSRSN
ncbi:TolC family protein [Acetohalobium arabaticum]|uniref:Outer membrane efflux protein n=1 Tax=Acetohalobium arabaticum (strain ATCC 49924 / DSM 5501 / Z-7288) TaxID=574087 RepID=D9QS65_ACEAZ|nr:TolC family protein [Acetohalobium arabaticum]ADL13356.1 outer membrane efflux protein [Acetohalobium arabaticum DSM 5501]